MDTPSGTKEWTEGRFLAFFADAVGTPQQDMLLQLASWAMWQFIADAKACAATDTLDDLARELRGLWDAAHSYGLDDGWKTLSDHQENAT